MSKFKLYNTKAAAEAKAEEFKTQGKGLFVAEAHGKKWALKKIADAETMEQALDEATKPETETITQADVGNVEDVIAAPKTATAKTSKAPKASKIKAGRKFVVRVSGNGAGKRGHYVDPAGKLTPWKFQARHFSSYKDADDARQSRGQGEGEYVDIAPFDNAWFEMPVDGKMTKFDSFEEAMALIA